MATPAEEGLTFRHDLETAALQALETHGHFRGRTRHIRIENHGGNIVLRGIVPSFYLKQVLQTIVRSVDGVRRIDNQVEVYAPRGPKMSSVA